MNKGQAKNNGVLENPPIAAQRKSNSNRKGKSGEQKAHSKKAACSNQRERLKNSKREVSSQQHGNQQGAYQHSPILRTEMGNSDRGRHAQAAHRVQENHPNGSISSHSSSEVIIRRGNGRTKARRQIINVLDSLEMAS